MATSKDVCATIVFGETSTLRAPGGSANEADLVSARRYIAGVVYNRYEGNAGQFGDPLTPTPEELKDPSIKKHWNLCIAAAQAAIDDDVGTCRHFVISWLNSSKDGPSPDDPAFEDPWPFTEKAKITKIYGPFTRNPRLDLHVFKYCGVK